MNKGVLENRSVLELYKEVVDDVLNNVRGLFLEEGIDETVLHQLQEVYLAHRIHIPRDFVRHCSHMQMFFLIG